MPDPRGSEPRVADARAIGRRPHVTVHVTVLGNEKGGSGRSTIPMYPSVALARLYNRVGAVDLDSRERSFFRTLDTRNACHERRGTDPGAVTPLSQAGTPRPTRSSRPVNDGPIDVDLLGRVGAAVQARSRRIGSRTIPGFSGRVHSRELFLNGLTLLDLKEGGHIALAPSRVAAPQDVRETRAGAGHAADAMRGLPCVSR